MNRLRLKIARWLAVPAAAGAAGCAQPGDDPAPPPEPLSQPEVAAHAKAPRARSFLVAKVRAGRSLVLRSRPRGKLVATVGSHTEFGDRTHLGVVRRLGNWVGVTTARLPNGRLGWF